jgi:7-cyano-7-deazaguanine synthase
MDTAVVLASGGLNSLVSAYVAREENELALLHVDYEHRSSQRELTCFQDIAAHLNVEKTLVAKLPCFAQIGGNARIERRQDVEDVNALSPGPSRTFVPGLMPALLGIAIGWAHRIGALRIVVGASENLGPPGPPTGTMYPDRRRDFFQRYAHLLETALSPRSRVRLETPLIDLNQEEIVRLGTKLEAPFQKTWSCLRSGEKMCGTCYGCATRTYGFSMAKVVDPLVMTGGSEK